jgi:hypothetical protein
MTVPSTVTFGIPLVSRAVAQNWARVVHQLNATIGSIYRQSDADFRIVIAGSDRPELTVPTDHRLEFLDVDQLPPMHDEVFIGDAVRKRRRIAERLRELGGGYLMLTDADDLISRNLVGFVRKDRHPNGYLVARGYMFDASRGVLSPFPFVDNDRDRFDQECGTSAIIPFAPDELPSSVADSSCRYLRLMAKGHPGVIGLARAEGRPMVDLPFRAVVYVRNTGENVSARSAATAELERIAFQARLDDQLERYRIERTGELDAEFNLLAATTPLRTAPPARPAAALGLSVLIATHRRPEGLRRLLMGLEPQISGRDDREVIVVNDGTDSADYAAIANSFPGVRYRAFGENRGVAAARNAGIDVARGSFSVFVDDDCVAPPWWLDWLTARLLSFPEIDVVAGSTTPLWSRRGFRERIQAEWFLPQPWLLNGRVVLVTANAAIRTDLLRALGGFGFPGFAGAGEDTEVSIRLHRAGARMLADPWWTVAHEVGVPLRVLARRYHAYGDANRRIAEAATIDIPDPPGVESRGGAAGASIRPLFRTYRRLAQNLTGGPILRVAAAAAATAVQSAYLRGLTGRG